MADSPLTQSPGSVPTVRHVHPSTRPARIFARNTSGAKITTRRQRDRAALLIAFASITLVAVYLVWVALDIYGSMPQNHTVNWLYFGKSKVPAQPGTIISLTEPATQAAVSDQV